MGEHSDDDSSAKAPILPASSPPVLALRSQTLPSQAWAVDRASAPQLIMTTGELYECSHAERCGGCPMIHLRYGEQLGLKRGRVVQAAARFPALELVYTEPVVPAEEVLAYRTRAKLIVASRARIGLFAKGGGHQVIDIPNCLVLSPVLLRAIAQIRLLVEEDELTSGPLAPYDASGSGALRAIDLREARSATESCLLLTLVLHRGRCDHEPSRYKALGERLMTFVPYLRGVAVNFHDGISPQILGTETHVVAGVASLPDRLGQVEYAATYGAFVQANRVQAERIHQLLADGLGINVSGQADAAARTDAKRRAAAPWGAIAMTDAKTVGEPLARPDLRQLRVLDLYGGSGAIALSLAARGADVTLVESYAPAAAQVGDTARRAGLTVRAICSDVTKALTTLIADRNTFDVAVVNPPRRGMSAAAREQLARLAPMAIAYVSCSPETLLRDLDHFARLGYAASLLTPFDMIPLTDEVETVTFMRRTTPEYLVSLSDRVHAHPDAADIRAAHELDAGVSGIAVFARTASGAELWRCALAAPTARRIYIGAARGVTPHKGSIARPLRDGNSTVPARSRFRRLAIAAGHSILRIVPEESHTHQVRRHLAAFGHPIIGDDRYGHTPTNRFFEEKFGLDRAFLHCVRLEVVHPATGLPIHFEAPLPGDLRSVLERAGGPDAMRSLEHKNALGLSSVPPPDSSLGRISIPPLPAFRADLPSVLDFDARERPSHSELQGDGDEALGRDDS
jgi:23S rRNA (uracil1939-C5)-methyltransferase